MCKHTDKGTLVFFAYFTSNPIPFLTTPSSCLLTEFRMMFFKSIGPRLLARVAANVTKEKTDAHFVFWHHKGHVPAKIRSVGPHARSALDGWRLTLRLACRSIWAICPLPLKEWQIILSKSKTMLALCFVALLVWVLVGIICTAHSAHSAP